MNEQSSRRMKGGSAKVFKDKFSSKKMGNVSKSRTKGTGKKRK